MDEVPKRRDDAAHLAAMADLVEALCERFHCGADSLLIAVDLTLESSELDELRGDVAFAHGMLNAMGIEQHAGFDGASLRHRMKLLVARAEAEFAAVERLQGKADV